MTGEDIQQIHAVMREVVAPVMAEIATIKADIAVIKAVQAEQGRDIALLRQDVIQLRGALEAVESRVEILTGMSVRVDGTAQEVSGLRRTFDHLDRRLRKLEELTPAG
jgi:hypothetical protein